MLTTTNIYYKVLQHLCSIFTMKHFRMKLYTPYLFSLNLISSYFYFISRSYFLEVGRNSRNGISMAHPYLSTLFHSFEQHVVLAERSQVGTTVLTRTCRFYFSAIRISHKLCTIANAQNRIFTPYLAQVYLECIFVIY